MIKISQSDREYYTKHLSRARSTQDKEFINKIDSDLYRSYYCGDDKAQTASPLTPENPTEKITLNKIFPATNRVVPTLYYQNPRIVFTPHKNSNEFSSKILTAAINYDYKEMNLKRENQQVILDAWYVGFGCCKIGYQCDFAYKDAKKSVLDKAKKLIGLPDKHERIVDYIEYEGPWAKRIKATDVFFDPDQPAGQNRIIWLHFTRTLQDIIDSDVYSYDSDFVSRFKLKDPREVTLDLYEGWSRNKDGLYIVVECDGYDKPIRYEKSSWQGDDFPLSFLSFAEVNDMRYPPSFLGVASQPQKHIDYLATLQGTVIDKFRNQTAVNEKALTEEGKRAVERNEIGGIIKFKEPPGPHIGAITSAPIPADLFNVLGIMQDNLTEILQVSGLRMGSTEAEGTATQDQIKDFGNQLGISGMGDKVKEYVKEQARKMAQMRKQFSSGKSLVPIVGMDITNPYTGKPITQEWLEFGTEEQPITLRQAVAGDYDVEVDIKSAQKPNEGVQLKLFENVMTVLPRYEMPLAEAGWKIDMADAVKKWLGLYKELVPSIEGVIKEMTPQEKQQLAQQREQMKAQQQQAVQVQQEMAAENQAMDTANKAVDLRKKMEEPPPVPEKVGME